ncbi:Stf0 family sulfotransferase [Pseudoalteromonas carrageenovora]|uniref:Stf0 family sulfotransferase n=1 Tax=Pseudoalteromonas carrageenovora TaxID=227 RepID=UPI002FD4E056
MKNKENIRSKGKNLIILCGTQRCGSTMVVSDFRDTGVLGKPEEYFIPWTSQRLDRPLEHFDGILSSASTENGNASIKIMANQLDSIESNLASSGDLVLSPSEVDYMFPHVRKLLNDSIFIKINRLNIVAQAVSRLMSEETGKNHFIDAASDYIPGNETLSNEGYNQGVNYNKQYLDKQVIEIIKENAKWDSVLKNWEKPPINLVYENCIDDLGYLSTLGKQLSLDIDINKLPKRKIKKIGNSKNDEFITKYSLDGTPSALESVEVDLLRDSALYIERENTVLAMHLMTLALKFRPSGAFIRKKIKDYHSNLK